MKPEPADLPTSERVATVNFLGVDVVVHHLSNGERVIEEASVVELLGAMQDKGRAVTDADRIAWKEIVG
jgi:hypothetical protein